MRQNGAQFNASTTSIVNKNFKHLLKGESKCLSVPILA